jgi:thiol-disulfide isomerase/thioredoxin
MAVRGTPLGQKPRSGTLSASLTLTRYLLQHSMTRFLHVLACLVALAALAIGCGSSDPESAAPSDAAARKALAGSPPPLAALHEQANELLGGGSDAFEARLRELRGYPVVVNKWGSWCPPCRRELPYFQTQGVERGKTIAFLGVDAFDPEAEAQALLDKLPLPYPSYKDPDLKVSAVFNGHTVTPVTAFYDSKGKLAYMKQGEYKSERDLVEDIERYAR